ncbi:Fanconi anemia group I protein isoform X2 [Frieseomelitta varia]|uniref:Fanconi anemia group I protein isoform X2 n=1 Tax=Frieseomelitta varia TaxID=561572 RepID=UPI001CB69B82|nr:Fanconi anemia group I protein isoform X2 [Frieseomelitta varia]
MNHQFEKLKERGNKLELRAFVQESSVEELMRLMRSSICKSDGIKVLDNLLQAFSDSEACQAKRRKLAEFTLKSLEKSNVSAGQANAIVNRIISDLPSYSKQQLVKFVDFCLTSIRNNDNELCSWKDLLPALLEALENEKYIVYADAEVSGTEYKSLIIKTICNYHWDVNLLPSLTKMFGDMVLDKADRNEVLKSLCSALPNLPLDQVPSFTYQALKLCPNRDNQKLLDALSKYFDLCYSKTSLCDDRDSFEDIGVINLKEVQDIESTVLYHVYQAAQLNHENMKDFIRFLKHVSHSEYMLQPFMFSVLMSVSGIYEDQIFEILRLAIVYNSLEKQKRQNSAWLRQILPTPSDIIGVIQQVIGSSNKDRHLVLRGLTNLAFTLMNDDQKSKNNAITTWHIGSEIIREIIKKHHETAPLILQELINKIIAGGVTTTHYIDCLKYMCRELSMIVLEHQVWIMTIVERLLFLHPTVANQVLFAIFPLVRVSPNIRENLLLILRKALYRKGVSKRQMAVMGFLEMLKCTKMRSQLSFRLSQHSNSMISSSSRSTLTQATLEYNSQRERSVTDCDKTLYYEILDILKKTFTYEFEVRLHLYESLYATVTKNPEITEIVLNMLLSHLNLYLNTDDSVLPPVKLELCTDVHGVEVILQEPIAQLIFTLQKIYINSVVKNLHTSEKLHDILKSLCNKMAITELEHLNLEHETNLLHGDFPKSQIKLKNLGIAIGIYEALMAFRIGEWSKENKENFHDINNLFKAYTRLIDFSKTPSTKVKKGDGNRSKKDKDANNTTKKSGKSTNIKIPNTIMDLDVIRQSLSLLFSQSSTQSDAPRRNHSFCCYILQTCEQLLQHTKPFVQNTFQLQNHQYINTYIDIGRLLYKYFVQNLEDTLTDDEQVTILALQCFKEISCCICTLLSSELQTFLNSIFEVRSKKDSKSTNINFQLQKIIFSLNPYLKKFLTVETDNNEGKKISLLLLQIIEQFTYKINFEDYNSDQMLECMKEIIQMEDIQSSIVPTIIQFFLNLEEYSQEYGETLNEICIELCEKVGSIDKTELETNNLYKSIREDTILQIYNVLNGHIKQKLDNASWLLMRLKAEDAIARAPGTIDERNNKLREKERNLCRQLSYIAQVLQTLANTSIKPGPSTDFTFKNLQYLYHLLGNLTKYFYAKSSSQNAAFQAVKFIQVVQLAGKPLKSTFYNLVTYVEENQNKLQSKSDSYAQRNKILKETKVIPRVVYEIEQFNKEILLLSKRTGVPLENYIKHSITRDFRIKNPQLVEGLEKMDVSLLISPNVENSESEIQTSNVNDSDSSNDDESSNKRPRIEDETVN